MTKIAILLLSLIAVTAQAQVVNPGGKLPPGLNKPRPERPGGNNVDVRSSAIAGAIATSASNSNSTATGGSATGGSASVSGVLGGSANAAGGTGSAVVGDVGASATGNGGAGGAGGTATVGDLSPSAVVNYNVPSQQAVTYGGTYEVRSVPSMVAPDIQPTAPCIVSSSLAASGLGFGVAGGTGTVDQGCEMRELSRLMYAYGHTAAAKELLCADERVRAAYARAGQACVEPPASAAGTQCYADPLVARRAGVPVCKAE